MSSTDPIDPDHPTFDEPSFWVVSKLIAIALKELGFDSECLFHYTNDEEYPDSFVYYDLDRRNSTMTQDYILSPGTVKLCTAPTYLQATAFIMTLDPVVNHGSQEKAAISLKRNIEKEMLSAINALLNTSITHSSERDV